MKQNINQRTNQWPNDKERDEEKEDRVAFDDHADISQSRRQKRKENVRAVERRQGHKVKEGEDDIDQNNIRRNLDKGCRNRQKIWQFGQANEKAKDDGDEEITSRTSGGN